MRTMLAVVGATVLAALVSGCLGGAAPAGSSTHRASAPPPGRPAATRVVVRYVVRLSTKSGLPMLQARCPALARCTTVAAVGSRPRRWALVASRTLTCAPNRGAYDHPAAACAALFDLARLEARSPQSACACPLELAPIPTAVGWVDHRRVRFVLGPCAACALGGRAWQDMRVLMPA